MNIRYDFMPYGAVPGITTLGHKGTRLLKRKGNKFRWEYRPNPYKGGDGWVDPVSGCMIKTYKSKSALKKFIIKHANNVPPCCKGGFIMVMMMSHGYGWDPDKFPEAVSVAITHVDVELDDEDFNPLRSDRPLYDLPTSSTLIFSPPNRHPAFARLRHLRARQLF